MAQTSQTPHHDSPRPSRRRFFQRAAIATVVAAVTAGLGLKAFAHGGAGLHGWHHGGFMGGTHDPAKLEQHLDRALEHVYVDIEATEAQKQHITPIVKAAAHDMLAVRPQLADGHRRFLALLAQPTIDRAELEALRAEHIHLIEQSSRRLTEALADAAQALTPAQRQKLAEHIGRRKGHSG